MNLGNLSPVNFRWLCCGNSSSSLMFFSVSVESFYASKCSNFSPLTRKEYFYSIYSLNWYVFSCLMTWVIGVENLDGQLACHFARKDRRSWVVSMLMTRWSPVKCKIKLEAAQSRYWNVPEGKISRKCVFVMSTKTLILSQNIIIALHI